MHGLNLSDVDSSLASAGIGDPYGTPVVGGAKFLASMDGLQSVGGVIAGRVGANVVHGLARKIKKVEEWDDRDDVVGNILIPLAADAIAALGLFEAGRFAGTRLQEFATAGAASRTLEKIVSKAIQKVKVIPYGLADGDDYDDMGELVLPAGATLGDVSGLLIQGNAPLQDIQQELVVPDDQVLQGIDGLM